MPDYVYQDRAVIFLDVLGFQENLKVFEEEAINNVKNNPESFELPVSQKANEFIDTFKSVVSVLDEIDFKYYLFSDNICISVDYVENKDFLIEILFTISELFYRFLQKGYFLRGGIDIGKFIDDEQIAVGVPLANAYLLENKVAVFPRIVISENYKKKLDEYAKDELISPGNIQIMRYLIKQSCEISYLNVFYGALVIEDKLQYFNNIKNAIEENLTANLFKEQVYNKYKWLAEEFNKFLSSYPEDPYLAEVIEKELTKAEKNYLHNLKIEIK